VGTSDKNGTVVGSQGSLRGPDSPPVTTQYVYNVEHQFLMLQGSELSPLSGVYTQRWSLPQVRSRHGIWCVVRPLQTKTQKGQNIGGY